MQHDARPAQWWQAIDRRTFGKGALAFTALASMSGCKGEEQVSAESLALQRKHGWNVGAEQSRLFFRNVSGQDSMGAMNWKPYTDPNRLMDAWRPKTEAWTPFFVPTLMQSLQSDSLRQQIRPVFSQQMSEAFGRGETLRKDLLSQVTKGEETLFLVDLPGPEAVAFGAGMAGWADVMVDFENWPHPFGVVRSHETLGAMLYYAEHMQKHKQELSDTAPGLLLLDNQRLAPYTDANLQFDNRYLGTVPRATALKQRGISHVMYIVPNRQHRQESDDLNDEFVEYKDAGIQVVIFPLSDLQKVSQPVLQPDPSGNTRTVRETRYYYGGGFGSHLGFLMLYSFLAPRPTAYYYHPYSSGPIGGRRITFGETTRPSTPPPTYTPRPRPTRFSGTRVGGQAAVGRRKPSGFGRTTVRTSGGRVTGIGSRMTRASSGSGRSGSFGRGGFFGG